MHIAVDVSPMPRQPVGAGCYMQNLVGALADIDGANRYLIVARRSDLSHLVPPRPNLGYVCPGISSPVMRLIWEQTLLPLHLSRNRVDLLHSTHYTIPLMGSVRRVVTFHDMTFFLHPQLHTGRKRAFFQRAIRLAARRADAIIADSLSTREDILRILQLDPAKVVAVPLGVSTDYRPAADTTVVERIRQKYHLPDRIILYVGTLEPRKNLPTLVRAFKSLVDRGVGHTLVLVGRKGWMYDDLFRAVDGLGISDRVMLAGYVAEEDLPALYQAADLFVYPSLYEGFGLPVLEAMACGVPVVTSNVSSMPEVAGDAALLVDPYNWEELAEAMHRALIDRTLHSELARRGPERARLFTWERTARETLAVYESVVHG